jgi:dTDP-4-amino-4,6-dideoxygalactose transaminase
MQIPLLDLHSQYLAIKPEIDQAIERVMSSQHFILGSFVQDCEKAIATYSNCAHGIGVSSGTDALLVCLMAEGIGPGDEVITTPYTFFATAGAIARLGAKPVFVDINPVTYNLDASQLTARITNRTRAIIPVHLYGQMMDLDPIMALAETHGLVVIEDAAQAIGAEWNGKRAGSIGHYGCFSFFPSKNLGAAGDAGMVVTNDPARAEKLRCLRSHGSKPKYFHKFVGGNFRLDALQAAIVSAKLPHLDAWTAARQQNASRYNRLFAQSGLRIAETSSYPQFAGKWPENGPLVFLPSALGSRHIFNQYVIRVERRDALKSALEARGVATEIYYPVPMHLQECFASLGHKEGDFVQSERAARETLALPVYPELAEAHAEYVVEAVKDYFLSAGRP